MGEISITNGKVVRINAQTGTTYTAVLSDADESYLTLSNAAAIAFTIPPNSTTPFDIGAIIAGKQLGAGQVTITAGAGVTINTEVGLKTNAQHSPFSLIQTAINTWEAAGSLAA